MSTECSSEKVKIIATAGDIQAYIWNIIICYTITIYLSINYYDYYYEQSLDKNKVFMINKNLNLTNAIKIIK